MGQLFHELFHAVTHTDKRILHLVKHLALRPARAAIEYWKVPAKKYFNPFTFLLIFIALIVIINNLVKTYNLPEPWSESPGQDSDGGTAAVLYTGREKIQQGHLADEQAFESRVHDGDSILCLYSLAFFQAAGQEFCGNSYGNDLFYGLRVPGLRHCLHAHPGILQRTAGFYYFTLLGVLLYAIYYTWGFKAF